MNFVLKWHTLTVVCAWACSAFTADPTIASLLVHFCILPVFLGLTVWLARHKM